MAIGLIGRKAGMTRIFTDEGHSIPVTVVEVEGNRVTQVRTDDVDGYRGIQVTIGERRASRVTKAAAGHYAKAGVEAGRGLWEFRLAEGEGEDIKAGETLPITMFEVGQKIDVTGQSKGKGFQGGIKRWNFQMQDATHGNSLSHRSNGSIGQCQTPGRVIKGKKMSGHMGSEQVTIQSLEVVRVDEERNLILIKGSVPGATGMDVIVKPSVKA